MKKEFEIKIWGKVLKIYNYYIIFWVSLVVVLVLMIMIGVYVFKFFKLDKEANIKSKNLERLSTYWQKTKEKFKTIFDLTKNYYSALEEKKKIEAKFEKYQAAYNHFLKYLYLPSLNIWKDPYTNKVDLTLIWPRFIRKNPFMDTNLITKRTSFFKHVGFSKDRFPPNDIKSLKIWKMSIDKKNNIFFIPISVELITSNRKTFIALVNKLSLTANKKNIALINEFFYYLFNEIKQEQEKGRKKIDYKTIWKYFYYWITNKTSDNPLLTSTALYKAIKDAAWCNSNSKEECYYLFRKEYESIPALAYNLWVSNSIVSFNKKKEFLRAFLKELPPLIEIENFVFNKTISKSIESLWEDQYVVQINFKIFWNNITTEEVSNISQVLAQACFWTWWKNIPKRLTYKLAYDLVNNILMKTSEKKVKSITTYNYRQILNYLHQFIENEKKYNNYEKAIKLFETYRILKANGFCKK